MQKSLGCTQSICHWYHQPAYPTCNTKVKGQARLGMSHVQANASLGQQKTMVLLQVLIETTSWHFQFIFYEYHCCMFDQKLNVQVFEGLLLLIITAAKPETVYQPNSRWQIIMQLCIFHVWHSHWVFIILLYHMLLFTESYKNKLIVMFPYFFVSRFLLSPMPRLLVLLLFICQTWGRPAVI